MLTSIAGKLGFGSGIDTAALVADLAAASRTPKVQRFDALAKVNEARVSALAQARGALDSLADSMSELTASGILRSRPVSSDENAVTVSVTAGVQIGNFSEEIIVSNLASAQTTYSGYIASDTAPIGQGVLTLTVGGAAYPVSIGPSNDSLNGLATAINASGGGVRASVVSEAGQFRLVLKGESGAANAFVLTADAGASQLLSQFSTGVMNSGQVARDATFAIGGVLYTRPVNRIDDIIPGSTISLKRADPANTISVSTEQPANTLKETLGDFVSAFNLMKADFRAARSADSGNSALRVFERQMENFVGLPLTSHASIRALSDIGVSTGKDGTILFDPARFDAVLRSDPDALEAIFNPPRDISRNDNTDPGLAIALDRLRDASVSNDGALGQMRASLQRETDTIVKSRKMMEARENAYQLRLEKQFAGMEARIGALKATQSYLEQQIRLWNRQGD